MTKRHNHHAVVSMPKRWHVRVTIWRGKESTVDAQERVQRPATLRHPSAIYCLKKGKTYCIARASLSPGFGIGSELTAGAFGVVGVGGKSPRCASTMVLPAGLEGDVTTTVGVANGEAGDVSPSSSLSDGNEDDGGGGGASPRSSSSDESGPVGRRDRRV